VAIRLHEPGAEDEWAQARRLVDEYVAGLGVDLSCQDVEHEIERLPIEYGPPEGCFLLAREGTVLHGCVGLRRFGAAEGEVKRLYVAPSARGRGAGRLLAEAIVARGRRIGYSRLVLDTLASMLPAQSLYRSLGFRPIAAYRFSPVPGTVYMALDL
jgi:GNAT superfamily N-acetyltransferase